MIGKILKSIAHCSQLIGLPDTASHTKTLSLYTAYHRIPAQINKIQKR
jgi:hypothetical protein